MTVTKTDACQCNPCNCNPCTCAKVAPACGCKDECQCASGCGCQAK